MDRARAVERLTALWALNEAGLGGLIHALRIPFTALVVGSTAVVLIALIAYFSERSARALVKATIVVLLVKGAASPHTPLPAYGAVALQVQGSAFFALRSCCGDGAGLLALLQGRAKLITMTIIYVHVVEFGLSALVWIRLPTGHDGLVLTLYLAIMCWRAGDGWLAGRFPSEIACVGTAGRVRRRGGSGLRRWRAGRRLWQRAVRAVVVLLALLLIYVAQPGAGNWQRGLKVALRVLIVLGLWMGVVRPYGMKLLRRFRRREQAVSEADVARALAEFPALRRAAGQAWRQSGTAGLRRWKVFLVELILLALTGPAAGGGELSAAVAEEGAVMVIPG